MIPLKVEFEKEKRRKGEGMKKTEWITGEIE